MNTQNQPLNSFLEDIKKRNDAARERARIEKLNKEYFQDLNAMGVTLVFQEEQ